MTDPIRARIIELIPEITKQVAGCRAVMLETRIGYEYRKKFGSREIYTLNPEEQHWDCEHGWIDGTEMYKCILDGDAENIGRPITLADVLRAIEKVNDGKTIRGVFDDGRIFHTIPHSDGNAKYLEIDARWNLTTDYDNQTQGVKEFVGKLLGVTE